MHLSNSVQIADVVFAFKLGHVPMQVFGAQLVECAFGCSLEHGPESFDMQGGSGTDAEIAATVWTPVRHWLAAFDLLSWHTLLEDGRSTCPQIDEDRKYTHMI